MRWLAVMALGLLAACGGGGEAGTPVLGSGTSTTGTGGSVTPTYALSLSLSTTTVTAATPSTVSAKLVNGSGVPQPNVVVGFSSKDGRGALSASSALTDANGVATVVLSPAPSATSGADTLTATATVNSVTSTATSGFQLTATNVSIASFVADAQTLAAYGQTGLTVQLSGVTQGTPVSVALTSGCVTKSRASLTPASVTTSTGIATFTYRDQGCGAFDALDSLQASVTGTAATANLQINLTSPTVSSISFVSADPQEIYLKGSGFGENSNITFQVRDANGAGVPNQNVLLEPTTLAGGLLIDGGAVPVVKRTDADGKVLVRINSGTVPTPVRVKATLQGSGISTVSSNLAVAVGLPSQLNFSLSQARQNIEGYDLDGTLNTYTIIASDRLGNPVPAGTTVNFIAEGGQIQAIRQIATVNGLASAIGNFQSASPRPRDGRITVLAYALGEESFLDTNGNNVFDTGEDYQDLGDVFLDRLLNGSFNQAEDQFISLSISGTDACRDATSPLVRTDNSMPSRARSPSGAALATCTTGWGRAYVRRSVETVLSTSAARPLYGLSLPPGAKVASSLACPSTLSLITGYNTDDSVRAQAYYVFGEVVLTGVGKTGQLSFFAADNNPVAFNPMAAGTTVSVVASAGLTATVAGGSPVPSTLSPSGVAVDFGFDDTTRSGTVTVSLRSPSGLTTSFTQSLMRDADTSPPSLKACP